MVSLSRGSLPTAILSALLLLPHRAVRAADAAVDEPRGRPLDRALTPFVPEVVELSKPRGRSATIVQQAFFEVTAGSEWVRIVDLQVVTYRTRGLQVYAKRGSAEGSENVPCHWQLVAETHPSWWGRWWQTVYPPWKDGFESVVVAPGETVSLYVRNVPGSYGILGERTSGPRNWYKQSWATTSAASAVGAVTMRDGRCGDRSRRPFFPCHRGYGGYAIYGGLKLKTVQDGSTQAPTAAPTLPFSPNSLTNPVEAAGDLRDFNGIQFSVDNVGDKDVMITSFDVHLTSAPTGLTHLQVWKRDGSHEGESSCWFRPAQRHNNFCRKWTQIAQRNVQARGPGLFTATPEFSSVVAAGSTASFAIVSQNGRLNTHSTAASAPAIEGEHLRINHAAPIRDYFGTMVQTSHDLDPTPYKFEGTVNYDVTNSACAALSKFYWTRLPGGSGSTEMDVGDPEENFVVYEPEEGDPEPEPPTDDEEPWWEGPVDEYGGPIEEGFLF